MKFIMTRKFPENLPETVKFMDSHILINNGFSFSFNPILCAECRGKCCKSTNKPSYLWITLEELGRIASFLNITEPDFKKNFLRRENGLHNIKDIKVDGIYSCIFLDIPSGKCSIYDVRPKQCRDYPFWDYYKNNCDDLFSECIAVAKNNSTL